jgi:hypothetical protein
MLKFICDNPNYGYVFQVESQVEESGLVVAGLYHAHDNLRDTHIDVFSQRIADKVPYLLNVLTVFQTRSLIILPDPDPH